MLDVNLKIEVPDIDEAVEFYCHALQFRERFRVFSSRAILSAGNITITFLQKEAAPNAEGATPTPIQLDIHVEDLAAAVERVRKYGAEVDEMSDGRGENAHASCRDPFGYRFWLTTQ